jgi:Predicted Fe-S oxidoreductases
VVHIDGLRERHDESVCKDGVFDEAVAAIKLAKSRGFKVNTNTTVFNTDTPQTVIDVLTYLNDDLGIDEMQISPAYAYEKAPDQEHFLGVEETRELFRKTFADGRRKKWRLNHTRCSWTSSRARPTSAAPRGAFPRTPCSAGRSPAT